MAELALRQVELEEVVVGAALAAQDQPALVGHLGMGVQAVVEPLRQSADHQ
jgi:hypothetical protein